MLDGLGREARELAAEPPVAPQPVECSLEIWLRWNGDAAGLRSLVKPRAALEQFTLTQAERCDSDPTVWRCAFVHVGRRVNVDHQIVSLMRRFSLIAPWLKVERIDAPVAMDDDPRELNWDDFARRALP